MSITVIKENNYAISLRNTVDCCKAPPLPIPLLHSEWRRGCPEGGRGGETKNAPIIIWKRYCFRILKVNGEFQEGKPAQIFTGSKLLEIQHERAADLELQMPSFIRGDENEPAEELFLTK